MWRPLRDSKFASAVPGISKGNNNNISNGLKVKVNFVGH